MKCRYCGEDDPNVVIQSRTTKHSRIRLYCRRCQQYTDKFGAPKILLFDLETSRGVYNLFRPGMQYVSSKVVKERSFLIGWSAKWLFSNKIEHSFVTSKEAIARDDRRVTVKLHKIMSKADMVIAHNAWGFDVPRSNWFFALHNLPNINRFVVLDTLQKARQIFKAESMSLDFLLEQFGFSRKVVMHQEDWDRAEAGIPAAIRKMRNYCDQDVWGLEDIYFKIRGWMKTHPNMDIFYEMYQEPLEGDEHRCPRCLETIHDSRWNKQFKTPSGHVYRSCNCPNCGAVLRLTDRRMTNKIRVR